MAKPTTVIARPVTTRDEQRATALEAVLEGASDHADALLEGLALLQALHRSGILEALVALTQKSDDVLGITMDTLAQQPAYTQGTKNMITLVQSLATLDEETVETTQHMVTSGIRAFASAQPPAKPLGVFDLLRQLKDPDISAGLTATLALLKGIGVVKRQRHT